MDEKFSILFAEFKQLKAEQMRMLTRIGQLEEQVLQLRLGGPATPPTDGADSSATARHPGLPEPSAAAAQTPAPSIIICHNFSMNIKYKGAIGKQSNNLVGCGLNTPVPVPPVPSTPTSVSPVRLAPLRVHPDELTFKPSGGMHHLNVVNESAERRAFKVKCSDNQLYRVNPVYGVVEPGQSVKIDILRQNGIAKADMLVILTGKAGTLKDGKEAFEQSSPAEQHMLVVPLLAAEA